MALFPLPSWVCGKGILMGNIQLILKDPQMLAEQSTSTLNGLPCCGSHNGNVIGLEHCLCLFTPLHGLEKSISILLVS